MVPAMASEQAKPALSSRLLRSATSSLLAAVKMRAAADVEQQAVGRIAGHQRRVTQAPVGDGFEQGGIGFGVFGDRLDAGMHGARLRQREAGRETKPLGRLIDADEDFGIAALAGRRQAAKIVQATFHAT